MDKNIKHVPDLKTWLAIQYVATIVGAIIVTWLFVRIVFIDLEGLSGGHRVIQGFMVIFIPFFTLMLPMGKIVDSRKYYLYGKWVLTECDKTNSNEHLINPWRRLTSVSLISGLTVAILLSIIIGHIDENFFTALSISVIAFIGLLIPSSILYFLYVSRDLISFVNILSKNKQYKPASLLPYFFCEHVGVMVFLQWVINMGLGFMLFNKEAIKNGGNVPSEIIIADIAIMTLFVSFFVWLFSQSQVRSDVHLGRISISKKKGLPTPLMVLSFVLIAAIITFTVELIFGLLNIEMTSVITALCIKSAVVVTAGVIGCILGIWWGRDRESALIRASENRDS